MSNVQMPAWLSAIVERALRPPDDMEYHESWATPTHVIGAEAMEANGDLYSDYASDLVGLLVDEITQLREQLAACRALLREACESIGRAVEETPAGEKFYGKLPDFLQHGWYERAKEACDER